MIDEQLQARLADTAAAPGVYLMKDADGRVIYVGKAASLKKRLSSYFGRKGGLDAKTGILVAAMADFETVVTATEKEALLLESNLIKKHKPRYNVLLKDDKRYPSLRLDVAGQEYPALEIVRRVKPDGARYFGPFTSTGAVRSTLKIIDKTFKLRKCREKQFRKRDRPCLNYQMGLCLAPCCREIPRDAYQDVVNEVTLFLNGRNAELLAKIKREMASAAEAQRFEQAAELRDKMLAVEKTLEKQVITTLKPADRDVFGLAENSRFLVLAVLHVRGGSLIGSGFFPFDRSLAPAGDILSSFLRQFYEKDRLVPDEILTWVTLTDRELVAARLRTLKGRNVRILRPQRGEKFRLVQMARENAAKELEDRTALAENNRQALGRLRKKLGVERDLVRLECFDNSHLGGTGTVAAMAVFENGYPAAKAYRRYRIRQATARDDYDCLREVLKRRYVSAGENSPDPDLLLVDGGRGQLNIALAVLKDLGLDGKFCVAAISKKEPSRGDTTDKVYLPGRTNPVNFNRDDPALFLLQHLRDEAHRLAITYQQRRRKKTSLASALDEVPGIGSKRKKMLLAHFGTLSAVAAAEPEKLAALPGITADMAAAIKKALQKA